MRRPSDWMPPALAILAIYSLRVDLQLLLEHFTWTTLLTAIGANPLAVAVLVFTPALMRRP